MAGFCRRIVAVWDAGREGYPGLVALLARGGRRGQPLTWMPGFRLASTTPQTRVPPGEGHDRVLLIVSHEGSLTATPSSPL